MSPTPEYLLLFRGTHWHKGLSPAEIQKVMSRWTSWFNDLRAHGKMKNGLPLMTEGKIVHGANGRFVTDGPFAESKEAIGVYFPSQCRGRSRSHSHRCVVEVRPVAERCIDRLRALEASVVRL